ncbi:histidine kinase [Paenibacillus sp. NPDC058174]|uniref:hybrid sensor histidine kinase/response regulator n=1 Tax=Paenibacillus sp. NPDC058174 TaxID=3346366 RepID=UPI0036D8F09A
MFRDKFILWILLLTATVALVIWMSSQANKNAPVAVQGYLDLSAWNFDEHAIVPLNGEWEFYPNQLLIPGDILSAANKKRYMMVPGKWEKTQTDSGISMRGMGFGTYRLLIGIETTEQQLAVAKNYIRFADKLYIDGVLMGESGQTGESRDRYSPRNVPYTVYFHTNRNEIEILLQVSNFDYKSGGIANSLYFGPATAIAIYKNVQTSFEMTGMFISLFFSLFVLSLYMWLHKNRLLLVFGAFFFVSAIVIITNGERMFMQLFPDIPFELAFKIKNMSMYLRPVLLFWIVSIMFEKSLLRKPFLAISLVYAVYCAGIVVLPFHVYSQLQEVSYAGILLSYALLIVFLTFAYVAGRFGTLDKRGFQLFGAAVYALLLTEVSVVMSNENMTSNAVTNFNIIVVSVLIVIMLARQYFIAYSSMRQLTQKLQIADRMKDEFLLLTSHELNTPLHGIINLAQTALEEKFHKSNEETIKERLRLIRSTAYRMSNLVKDLIDAAKLKEDRLQLELRQVDLVTCVSVIIEVFGFLAKGRNATFASSIAPDARYIVADEIRLMQVLYNAIDYCLMRVQDGEIVIGSRREQGAIVIEIACEPTARSEAIPGEDSAPDEDAGVAIGLSIASELILRMNGRFERPEDAGCIRLFMPAAGEEDTTRRQIAASSQSSPQTSRISADDGAPRVLIASADPLNLEQLYGMLEMDGYAVTAASSDREAWTLVTRASRPDIVLLDVMLPEANGYELCRQIRDHFTHVELPVLLISARNTPADIETGISSGVSDFIARPLDAGEIRMRLRTLLSIKRLAKEAALNEMAFLQSQIKPHFLYNALGTIMSLCYTDGPRAGELLAVFSKYLRIIFHLDNIEETVSIRKEMELVQAYVDIEKVRFGERIRFELDADKQLYDCQVMPLTIEPLVENAIRHGISKKIGGGTVRLTIRSEGEYVQITVKDDGVGMTPAQVEAAFDRNQNNQGIGFLNIVRRVAHLTDKRPAIESEPGSGTTVTIWLPAARTATTPRRGLADESVIG